MTYGNQSVPEGVTVIEPKTPPLSVLRNKSAHGVNAKYSQLSWDEVRYVFSDKQTPCFGEMIWQFLSFPKVSDYTFLCKSDNF